MKLGTIEASQSEKTLSVEKPFSGYGFELKTRLPVTFDKDKLDTIIVSNFLKEINTKCVMSLAYVKKDGNPIRPFNSLGIIELCEYAQRNEGSIVVAIKDVEIEFEGAMVTRYDLILRAYFPITPSGNILFNNDETAQLTVTTQENTTLDVWTIESAVSSPDYFNFTTLDILADKKEVSFDTSKIATILIPAQDLTATTEIQLTYTNGKIVRMRANELEFISSLDNDVTYQLHMGTINESPALVIPSRGMFHILDINETRELRITRDSKSAFSIIAVTREVVQDVRAVQDANRGLIDLTELKLNKEISNKIENY